MKTRFSTIAASVGFAVAYFAAARFDPWLGNQHLDFSPLWPAGGVGMTAMLLAGRIAWPAVLVGAFSGMLASLLGVGAPWGTALVFGFLVAGGETLQLSLAAWLTSRFIGGAEAFDKPQTVLGFAGIVSACTAINPTVGALVAPLFGVGVAESWLTWWVADVVSVLVLVPLLVTWWTKPWPALTFRRKGELTVLLLCLILLWESISSGLLLERTHAPLLYFLVVPLLLWSALRLGEHGAAVAVLILACAGNLTAMTGRDIFLGQDRNTSFLMLEGFLGVMAIMASTLAADAGQRQRAQDAYAASEQRHRELFDINPFPIWVYDTATFRFLAVNKAAIMEYGYSREEFLQMRTSDIELPQQPAPASRRAGLIGEGFLQRRHRRKDGREIEVEIKEHPLVIEHRPATMVISNDITEQRRAEERAAIFSTVGQRLSSARTRREAGQIVVEAADALFGWHACTLELCSPGHATLAPVLRMDLIDGRRQELPLGDRPAGPLARAALEKGASLVLRRPGEGFPPGAVPFGDVSRPSLSVMSVPLRKDDKVLGVLSIQSYSANAYTDADLRSLQALADVCGGAFERIRVEEEIARVNVEARRHLEELQTLFDVAPVGIAVAHDPECNEISVNDSCAAMFGLEPGLKLRLDNDLPFELRRAGRQISLDELPMRSAARTGLEVGGEEVEVALRNGRVLTCYTLASPLYDGGQVRGSLGIFVDLTERKQAEQEILRLNAELERRVRERTVQLEAINKELEAFSYSVSHDLRAPLRSIRGFSEVLLERYSASLDRRGQEFLRRACESCAHMDRLIEDLLKLSRVGRSELQPARVDLSAVAESIGADLQRNYPEHRVDFKVMPGLKTHGDERLLRVALENLLRNAWKFTGKRSGARVEFGQVGAPEPAYYVRDNGAGFDMAYAGKLFGVFQRLHTATEFPGTGVGLATVQRIINRHGGRTWATGAVDQGACFYFTLPQNQEEK